MDARQILTENERRHLLLLIDGTWVSASCKLASDRHSNIYKLNLFIETHSALNEAQVTFYIPGIGSPSQSSFWWDRLLAGVDAFGIERLVEEAYINIVSNFIETDEIYIFGFSRGAVIARIVAEMISKYGILKPQHIEYYPKLWEDFRTGAAPDLDVDNVIFRRHRCIQFLGLFDTVAGPFLDDELLQRRFFEKKRLPEHVRSCVHLLALNETRVAFRPTLFDDVSRSQQYLEQIWMPGVHSDVGGGYADDFFGKVALLTMIDRLQTLTSLKISKTAISRLQNSIRQDFESDTIAINEELANTREWALVKRRVLSWTGFARPRRPGMTHQYYHPICCRLKGHFLRMKSDKAAQQFSMVGFRTNLEVTWISLFDDLDLG